MFFNRLLLALCVSAGVACSGGTSRQTRDIGEPVPPAVAPPATCGTGGLMDSIGLNHLLIGYADDQLQTPFDLRCHAPLAKVGLHASGWGTNFDVLLNRETWLDPTTEGVKLGQYLESCGADSGDFIVADMSDRDAGCYQYGGPNCGKADTWWDDTNTHLPNFTQAFTWATAVADTLGLPVLWWQIPVGNMDLNNTVDHWKDNRVDYLFNHLDQVTAARGIGLAFGAGAGGGTRPSTDGGNLAAWANTYRTAGGAPVCP